MQGGGAQFRSSGSHQVEWRELGECAREVVARRVEVVTGSALLDPLGHAVDRNSEQDV